MRSPDLTSSLPKPSCSSASSGMSLSSLQASHSRRASRCAMIRRNRGRDRVGLHAHVDQARQRARRIVGMQRGQHEVARLCGLDRDLRGFQVADLTDHDHVRILAQECFQRRCEGQADLRVHVDLVDAGQVDLRRVFRGRNVPVLGIEDVQAGVQRHGLTGAGRAGNQDHAVGLVQRLGVQVLLETSS